MLGAVAGLWRIGEELLDSSMQMLRTIPFLALVPLFIVWLGIGETPKIVLIALATVFPMYLNTYNGVRSVDRKVVEGMRSFGVTGWRLVREVVFPLALPSILTGLRFALGVSVLALIAAEQINASNDGLGHLMIQAQTVPPVRRHRGVHHDLRRARPRRRRARARCSSACLMPWRASVSR